MKHLSIPSLIFAAIFALSAQNYAGSTLVQAFSVGLGFPRAASCRARATRNEMAFGVGITATTRATTTGTSTTLNGGTKIVSLDFATDLLDEAEDVFESLEELVVHLQGKTAATADWALVNTTLSASEHLQAEVTDSLGDLAPLSLIRSQLAQVASNMQVDNQAARAEESNQDVPALIIAVEFLALDVADLIAILLSITSGENDREKGSGPRTEI